MSFYRQDFTAQRDRPRDTITAEEQAAIDAFLVSREPTRVPLGAQALDVQSISRREMQEAAWRRVRRAWRFQSAAAKRRRTAK